MMVAADGVIPLQARVWLNLGRAAASNLWNSLSAFGI